MHQYLRTSQFIFTFSVKKKNLPNQSEEWHGSGLVRKYLKQIWQHRYCLAYAAEICDRKLFSLSVLHSKIIFTPPFFVKNTFPAFFGFDFDQRCDFVPKERVRTSTSSLREHRQRSCTFCHVTITSTKCSLPTANISVHFIPDRSRAADGKNRSSFLAFLYRNKEWYNSLLKKF